MVQILLEHVGSRTQGCSQGTHVRFSEPTTCVGMQRSLGCSAKNLYHFAEKVDGHYLSQDVKTLSHSLCKVTHMPYPITTKKGSF